MFADAFMLPVLKEIPGLIIWQQHLYFTPSCSVMSVFYISFENPQSCLHFPSVLHTFSFYIIKIRILLYTIPRICPVSRSPPLVQVFVCQLFRLERKLVELLLFLLLSVLPLEKIWLYNLP